MCLANQEASGQDTAAVCVKMPAYVCDRGGPYAAACYALPQQIGLPWDHTSMCERLPSMWTGRYVHVCVCVFLSKQDLVTDNTTFTHSNNIIVIIIM